MFANSTTWTGHELLHSEKPEAISPEAKKQKAQNKGDGGKIKSEAWKSKRNQDRIRMIEQSFELASTIIGNLSSLPSGTKN